ncbi:hypothetical protein F8178_07740 [Haloechinothrix sp. LS1_15]|nr:hypothetical protein [Haloechinothrix sp. LS1_15]
MSTAAAAATVAIYVAVMLAPGALVGLAAGLRGWTLATVAPLLTFAVAGITGPWLALARVEFTVPTFAAATAMAAALALAAHLLGRRASSGAHARRDPARRPPWSRAATAAVACSVLLAAVIGGYVVLRGLGTLGAISQGFDAPFHANGIRYLADTGDGSVTGMTTVNRFDGDGAGQSPGSGLLYPHAYHLVAALAYQLAQPFGATVPAIVNANTVLLPGVLALSFAGLVRAFRGRAVLAATAAIVATAPAPLLYISMARGPILPFLLGLSLTPVAIVVLRRFLERGGIDTGFVLALCGAGLLAIHPATLLTAMLLALPVLAQRWLGTRGHGTLSRDTAALTGAATAGVLLGAPHVAGALARTGSGFPYDGWPAPFGPGEAVQALLTFQLIPSPHSEGTAQLWLALALLCGLAFVHRLGELRWVAGAALLTGLAWLVVAVSDHPLVLDLTRPWWNDPFRFMAMAAIPLTLLAAHGLAEVQAVLRDAFARWARRRQWQRRWGATARAGALGAVVITGFAVLSQGLYAPSNAALIGPRYGNPPPDDPTHMAVSDGEVEAMVELGKRAGPDEWALNNRHDGTVWTYAISGVRSVAAHYDDSWQPPRAELLAERFADYATDPQVRAAVAELDIRWVIVGTHGHLGLPPGDHRQPGLTGLDELPFLESVFRNEAATLYEITEKPAEHPPRQPDIAQRPTGG